MAVCALGSLLFLACSDPLRAQRPGTGGAPGVGGATGRSGGTTPVTYALGLGGRPATGGASGTGGLSGTGGAVSTGGSLPPPATVCTPERCLVALAWGRESIWPGIALDGSSAYWTEHTSYTPAYPGQGDGRVLKVPLAGGTPTLLADKQDFPSHVRADATSVTWTTWSAGIGGELAMDGKVSLMRMLSDGGKPSTVFSLDLYPPGSYPVAGDIAIDAASAYWAYQGTSRADFVDGAISRVSLADGSRTILATALWHPCRIAVDGTSIYWVNAGSAKDDREDTSLNKMPLSGGTITTLDVSPSDHRAIVLDATHVYWTSYRDGTVRKLPLAGGTPVTLAAGQARPTELTVDATHVYWINYDGGTVMKVPREGGPATTLAVDQPALCAIAVDATSVYWTTMGTAANNLRDGTLMKLTPK